MPLPLLPMRDCSCGCGRRYQPTRRDQKYATAACNVTAYRKRRKEKETGVNKEWWHDLEKWQSDLCSAIAGDDLQHAGDLYRLYDAMGMITAWNAVLFSVRMVRDLDSRRALQIMEIYDAQT